MTNQFSDREIKQAVVDRYGARARNALESSGVEGTSADACCGPADAPQALQFVELETAGSAEADACCGPDGCAVSSTEGSVELSDDQYGSALYDAAQLSDVPDAAQLASAGCGNPVAIAELNAGDAVLDLGSGGGIDCFLSVKQVGDSGEVWGLDMTPDMIQLARHNAEQVDAKNVRFRLGEIEDIPFEDSQFDVVISNCVINLSPDKPQVFRETYRTLKPGGRLRVSDIVITRDLEQQEQRDLEAWAGCVAGALPVEQYLDHIRDAGFTDVSAQFDDADGRGIASAYVSAVRPL
ncbi:MAG TPA: arsenite methyltransferase [Dehalococcoidia bacterium]|nr:arsenite methyltransferase [Dehalococcoidia bacterium]